MPTVAWKCSIAQLGNCPGSLLSLSESSIGCLVTSPSCAPPGCGLIDPLHPFQIAQSSNSTSNSRDELTQSNLLVSWSLILPEHHWNHNSTQHCTGSHSDHSIDHCPIQHKCDRPLSIWRVSYWMFLGFFSSASACLWSSDSHTYSLIRYAGQNCEHRLECVYLQIRGGPFGPLPFRIQIPAKIFEDPLLKCQMVALASDVATSPVFLSCCLNILCSWWQPLTTLWLPLVDRSAYGSTPCGLLAVAQFPREPPTILRPLPLFSREWALGPPRPLGTPSDLTGSSSLVGFHSTKPPP